MGFGERRDLSRDDVVVEFDQALVLARSVARAREVPDRMDAVGMIRFVHGAEDLARPFQHRDGLVRVAARF